MRASPEIEYPPAPPTKENEEDRIRGGKPKAPQPDHQISGDQSLPLSVFCMYEDQCSSMPFRLLSQFKPSKNQLALPGSDSASESELSEKPSSCRAGGAASSMKDIVGTCPN